jgi:Mrp family chromosome partitioning ATPase
MIEMSERRPTPVPMPAKTKATPAPPVPIPPRAQRRFNAFQEQCRQLSLQLFFDAHAPLRSLGITSAIPGEGKTFLASVIASTLANDTEETVVLAECNWEHPTIHNYFGIPASPGLAEWQRGECTAQEARRYVGENLIVIPAGHADRHAARLLHQMRERPIGGAIARPRELLVLDLPAIATTAYGALAASLVEAVLLVVRAGVTPRPAVAGACAQLKGVPLKGIVLNRIESQIPGWIREVL